MTFTHLTAQPLKLVPQDWRADALHPDDGSQEAALRRALALMWHRKRHHHPDGGEAEQREVMAIARLIDGDARNPADMATIAEGLREQDVERDPGISELADEYDPAMTEPELRRWAAAAVVAMNLAGWTAEAEDQDWRQRPRRVERRAVEMRLASEETSARLAAWPQRKAA